MSDPQEQMRKAAREVGKELARAIEQAAKLARQAGEDLSRAWSATRRDAAPARRRRRRPT